MASHCRPLRQHGEITLRRALVGLLKGYAGWASLALPVAAGVKLLATLWFLLSWSPPPEQAAAPDRHAAQVAAQQWQMVGEQQWFGRYQPGLPAAEAAPVAETQLQVVLRGIAYGAYPTAVIEEAGEQHIYSEGDALSTYPATVGKIQRDHLLLHYQGETERLSLVDETGTPADADR